MQKNLRTIIGALIITSTLNADLARVEMGTGVWNQTPTGSLKGSADSIFTNIEGTYTTDETSSQEFYFWMLLKHPIPLIPNLRMEYVSIEDIGVIDGTVNGIDMSLLPTTPTNIKMKQFDIIPYYNILDNTFWTTVDVGLDIKVIQADVDVKAVENPTTISALDILTNVTNEIFPGYSTSETVPIPLAYIRGRVEIPFTGVGIESDVKYLSFDGSTIYDIRAKVDYTFDITPIIQPAIEVGYRTQKYDIHTDDTNGCIEYSGLYAGLILRF